MPKFDLTDRVVVITGAARGIGLATAKEVDRRGGVVALIDRDTDAVTAAAAEIGGRAVAFTSDVVDRETLRSTFAQISQQLGRIDVVIANAGIGPVTTTADVGNHEHAENLMKINFDGVWNTLRVGSPEVIKQQGHLLVISSVASFAPTPSWSAYGASKAGVESLARSLRIELAPLKTSVGVAHFALVNTALVDKFAADPLYAEIERLMPKSFRARTEPEKVAVAVVNSIQRRAPRLLVPGWLLPIYLLRGVLEPALDGLLVRSKRAQRVMLAVRERDLNNS